MSVSSRFVALVAAAAITAFSFAGPAFATPAATAQHVAASAVTR